MITAQAAKHDKRYFSRPGQQRAAHTRSFHATKALERMKFTGMYTFEGRVTSVTLTLAQKIFIASDLTAHTRKFHAPKVAGCVKFTGMRGLLLAGP